jgi:hypothetical protein
MLQKPALSGQTKSLTSRSKPIHFIYFQFDKIMKMGNLKVTHQITEGNKVVRRGQFYFLIR